MSTHVRPHLVTLMTLHHNQLGKVGNGMWCVLVGWVARMSMLPNMVNVRRGGASGPLPVTVYYGDTGRCPDVTHHCYQHQGHW